METLHKRVAGIDVHRMKHVVTVLIEDDSGQPIKQQREFGGFKRDLKGLAAWLWDMGVELVILESTGIYWKSVYAHLEAAGVLSWVVGLDSPSAINVVCAMTRGDFCKSMTTHAASRVWQDVYHCITQNGKVAYVKVTLRVDGS